MTSVPLIFDRLLLRHRRNRSARHWEMYHFLHQTAANRLAERLEFTNRPFKRVLDFGCRAGEWASHILTRSTTQHVVTTDLALEFARTTRRRLPSPRIMSLVADEEALPFASQSFNLVTGCLSLHTINDLPGTLARFRRLLAPDGMLLTNFFGGPTLGALRAALTEAEIEIYGGARPRIAPFTDIRDAGTLLQRAGFVQPVVDDEAITVTYDNIRHLMHDLRGMAETNTLIHRHRTPDRRALFSRAEDLYKDRQPDGRIAATFHILTLTAWTASEESDPLSKKTTARMKPIVSSVFHRSIELIHRNTHERQNIFTTLSGRFYFSAYPCSLFFLRVLQTLLDPALCFKPSRAIWRSMEHQPAAWHNPDCSFYGDRPKRFLDLPSVSASRTKPGTHKAITTGENPDTGKS